MNIKIEQTFVRFFNNFEITNVKTAVENQNFACVKAFIKSQQIKTFPGQLCELITILM